MSWRRLSMIGVVAAVAVGAAIFVGSITSRDTASAQKQHYDAGVIDLATGSPRVEHSFRFENRYSMPIEIVGVASSCGCLHRRLSALPDGSEISDVDLPATILPGDTIAIEVAYELSGPGRRTEAVTLKTGRGATHTYMLAAEGVASEELKLIVKSFRRTSNDCIIAEIDAIFVTYAHDDAPPLKVQNRMGVTIDAGPWTTIERRSVDRPARFLTSLQVEARPDADLVDVIAEVAHSRETVTLDPALVLRRVPDR